MRIREPALRFSTPLVRRRTTKRIILHHTASDDVSVETVHDWHLERTDNRGVSWGGVGYHYLIRLNGAIERGRPENVRGVHASSANADSIAVVLTGNFENHAPSTSQLNTLDWLVADIRTRYQGLQIQLHSDVGDTLCPGRHFTWKELELMFTDQDQALFPREIQRAAELGLIAGFPDRTFRPKEPVTREQVVYMLLRMWDRVNRA